MKRQMMTLVFGAGLMISCGEATTEAELSSNGSSVQTDDGNAIQPIDLKAMKSSSRMLLHDWQAAGDEPTALSILQGSWKIVLDGQITGFELDKDAGTASGGVLNFENIRRINNNGDFWDIIGDIFFGWLPEDKDRYGADMSMNFSKELYNEVDGKPFKFEKPAKRVSVSVHYDYNGKLVAKKTSLGNYGGSRAAGLAALALTASKVLKNEAEKRKPSVKFSASQLAFIDAPDQQPGFITACESDPEQRVNFNPGTGKVKYFAYYADSPGGQTRTLGCIRLWKSAPGAGEIAFMQMRVGSKQTIVSLGTPTAATGPFKYSEWMTFAK
ncbi:MAG: hypothetical protein HRU19_05860 [Pseudobacteriovorax sp.]|nr:hypothetical protein [Pseudobacteriovorax sp.]